jgi:pilus assembly protein Flp/PilA
VPDQARGEYFEEERVTNFLVSLLIRMHRDEAGQGLVEYLLVLALVAFAATAGMHSVANSINSSFTQIGSILGLYIKS